MGNSKVKFIEAVVVCVDYSDFLVHTALHNRMIFDRLLVVTSFDDKETKKFCHEHSIECRQTNLHKFDGCDFAKGRMIDFGLGFLEKKDWLVHLDADIWLPPMSRQWLEWSMPEQDCIYGIDRCDCKSYDEWVKYQQSDWHKSQYHQHCLTIPPPFPMGARISIQEHGGYVPIGFFQMWHGSVGNRYPHQHTSAERTDVLHGIQWPKEKRRLLPEIIGIHLTSAPDPKGMGMNWNGREAPQFGKHDPFGERRKANPPKNSTSYNQ